MNYSKHLRRNSFRAGLGTTFLPSKIGPQTKLNGGSKRWLILKYSFPTKTLFKSKITCKGFTFVSFMSIGGKDLKPPRTSSFPLSSLVVSWRTPQTPSSLGPLNPARGECGRDRTNRLKFGRDGGGDKKPCLGKG